jgi:hypothetical protein
MMYLLASTCLRIRSGLDGFFRSARCRVLADFPPGTVLQRDDSCLPVCGRNLLG